MAHLALALATLPPPLASGQGIVSPLASPAEAPRPDRGAQSRDLARLGSTCVGLRMSNASLASGSRRHRELRSLGLSARRRRRTHDDLHILAERHQKPHQPLDRELTKVPLEQLGNVRLLDAE